MTRRVVIVTIILFFFITPVSWSQAKGLDNPPSPGLTTIIIVRHAEKDTMKNDPPLTQRGKERAAFLAGMLRSSGIAAIYTTQFNRTRETVRPLAESLGIKPQVLTIYSDSIKEHVASLAREIFMQHTGGVVLVSGHSNVIPLLLKELGVKDGIALRDDEYDNVFIVTAKIGGEASLLRLRY